MKQHEAGDVVAGHAVADRLAAGGSDSRRRTIADAFLAAAQARPSQATWLTLIDADGTEQHVATQAFVNEVLRWRAWFGAKISGPGERVAICLAPSLALYGSFLGAILAGATPSIFSPPSPKQKLEDSLRVFRSLLASSGSRILITTVSEFAELADDCMVAFPHVVDGGPTQDPNPSLDPDAPAFVQYSSGTTGLKKGVAVTHAALIQHVEAYARAIGLNENDRIVSWLPLYHDMGLITALFLPFLTATPLVALSPLDWVSHPSLLLSAIERHRATLCWQPNFAYNFLSKYKTGQSKDLSSMRLWVNCSERVMDDSHRMFLDAFGTAGVTPEALGTCYAMAENVFAVTSSYPGAPAHMTVDADLLAANRIAPVEASGGAKTATLISSGSLLPGVSVRIHGPDDRALDEGEIGEIAIRTPWLFEGYSGQEGARFLDSHFLTGDTGFLRGGELFVLGRKKDILIIAGRNIYPQDIEAVVDETPGVVAGRCVAFAVPNPALGTDSLVVLAETREADQARYPAITKAITARIGTEIGVAPETVALVRHMTLIKATSGKISRGLNRDAYLARIQKLAAAAPAAVAAPVPAAVNIRTKVQQAIGQVLNRKPVGNISIAGDDSLFELGVIDSLSFIELVLELERTFEMPIPPEVVHDPRAYDSLNALVKCFERRISQDPGTSAPQPAPENPLVRLRERRIELAPQFSDSDRVLLQPFPYLMLTPTPNFASGTANSDAHGFRVAVKDGKRLSAAEFEARPGDKGIVLGNSMSWGTGASDDAHVVHNVLNREMADTAWYSYALRQSVLTQERIAANLFAPLDVTHVVWITGSVLIMNALTRLDHKACLPFPQQTRFESAMGFTSQLRDFGLTQRVNEISAHIDREIAMLSRIYSNARSLVFVWQPTLMHYDKPMTGDERELMDIARRLPGKPTDPVKESQQRQLSQRLAGAAQMSAARHGVRFVDPAHWPVFQSDEELFVDPEHLNDRGHEALAGIIREHLAG